MPSNKFRNTFCARSPLSHPNNVIEFKSKKPKNHEFSGFSINSYSADSDRTRTGIFGFANLCRSCGHTVTKAIIYCKKTSVKTF